MCSYEPENNVIDVLDRKESLDQILQLIEHYT